VFGLVFRLAWSLAWFILLDLVFWLGLVFGMVFMDFNKKRNVIPKKFDIIFDDSSLLV
jgi:hypothetical protein